MIIQPVVDIPEICFLLGIKYAVISPGSRSAHITLAFAKHPGLKKYIFPDERSAGYIALGLAQSSEKPVVLICTSGTAAVNFYPAITEAYYQNVPLIVLTADRPAEWIDKNDGQTIRQNGLYSNHIKDSFLFPEKFGTKEDITKGHQIIEEAIERSFEFPQGPVHVNVPIREPFYPGVGEEMEYQSFPNIEPLKNRVVYREYFDGVDIEQLKDRKVAIVCGQSNVDDELIKTLNELSESKGIPVFSDVISNVRLNLSIIKFHDSFDLEGKNLVPDVIISMGRSILSKRLKLALRNKKSLMHYHIKHNDYPADTYLSLTKVFRNSPHVFFKKLMEEHVKNDKDYLKLLTDISFKAEKRLNEFLRAAEFGEFKAFHIVWNHLPEESIIHLANSMPVRYANILGTKNNWTIYSNRGTSGIDGSNSTAVGHALHNGGINFLLTGDMAFFYDRNAFWHDHIPQNLKIVIFNNHGGGIFRLIDGPDRQPELEEYFETSQRLIARNTASDLGIDYYFCRTEREVLENISAFLSVKKPAILEIETDKYINQKVFQAYKQTVIK